MPQDDEMQVGVFRIPQIGSLGNIGLPVEMGGGRGNLIRIWACHWSIEVTIARSQAIGFIGCALSSNPEHEFDPPLGFVGALGDKALYGRAIWNYAHNGEGDTTSFFQTQVIPVYGLVRPRRQIMTAIQLWGELELVNSIGLEVYYTPMSAPSTEREEVNRKYGKYRRS